MGSSVFPSGVRSRAANRLWQAAVGLGEGSSGDPHSEREESVKGLVLFALSVALVVAGAASARSQATRIQIAATMSASEETPTPKGEVGSAHGSFTGTLAKSDSGAVLTWQLSFSGLTGDATAAHIHIADRGKSGPVVVPLCAPCASGATGRSSELGLGCKTYPL